MVLQLRWQLKTGSVGKGQIFLPVPFMPLYESTWAAECNHESREGFEEIQATRAIFSAGKRTQPPPRLLSSPLLCRSRPAAERRADGANGASWDVQIPISGMLAWF